jgi:hypothetical protein
MSLDELRPRTGAAGVLGLVVLAALSMAASGSADPRELSAPPSISATEVPIQHRQVVCPDFASAGTTVVEVASNGSGSGTLRAGVDQLRDLPSGNGVFQVENQAADGVRVTGDGAPAAGLLALRHDTRSSTAASVDCVEPQAEWWFAGGGASVTHRSFLVLRNLAPGDATLRVRVFTAQGEAQPLVDGQVVVPGNSGTRIDLALLASFEKELTISLVAERGLVAAAVHDSIAAGASPAGGVSWLSGQSAPQRTLVFAGDFSGDKSDQLVVTNPSSQDATVSVEVAAGNGWFAPQATPGVTVGAGQVTTIDLAGSLAGGVRAVRVSSTRPVVGVLRRTTGSDMSESEPLPVLGSASGAVVPEGKAARLVLVGGPQGGQAQVSWSDAAGHAVESRQISLGAGEATILQLSGGARRVDVAPAGGSLFAVVSVRGPGLDTVSVSPLVLSFRQAVVTPVSE